MARKDDVYHEFQVEELKYESGKAYLFKLKGLDTPVWIPKSQADYDEDTRVVHASDWIVRQKEELQLLVEDL